MPADPGIALVVQSQHGGAGERGTSPVHRLRRVLGRRRGHPARPWSRFGRAEKRGPQEICMGTRASVGSVCVLARSRSQTGPRGRRQVRRGERSKLAPVRQAQAARTLAGRKRDRGRHYRDRMCCGTKAGATTPRMASGALREGHRPSSPNAGYSTIAPRPTRRSTDNVNDHRRCSLRPSGATRAVAPSLQFRQNHRARRAVLRSSTPLPCPGGPTSYAAAPTLSLSCKRPSTRATRFTSSSGSRSRLRRGTWDTSGNYLFTDAAGETFPGLTHEAYRRQADGSCSAWWTCGTTSSLARGRRAAASPRSSAVPES